jgi:hypothetical protein
MESLKGGCISRNSDLAIRIILKRLFEKQTVKAWSGLNWKKLCAMAGAVETLQ